MDYQKQIEHMIDVIKNYGIDDKIIFEAMRKVPRHLFVGEDWGEDSYVDGPLPIGYGQTISQPYTVAFMIKHLELKKGIKVLEIGAGSGWCAALIGQLVGEKGIVYTTEIVPELVKFAQENNKKAKVKNVKIIYYDGSKGYPEKAPYDRIIITAACPKIPQPIIEQLKGNGKDNGIIIAPVGGFFGQKMIKLVKENNKIKEYDLGYFSFVPLKGEHGYD